jgi:hypothetical protein
MVMSCSSNQSKSPGFKPPLITNAAPIRNSPPYWCDLVPQEAFLTITGISGKIYESRDGWLSYNGLCLVYQVPPIAPLGVSWARNGIEIVQRQEERYRRFGLTSLHRELGTGFSVNAPDPMGGRPYYVIATFRCGDISPWLSIDLARVAYGRNATQDLSDLMRIAESRFGELHGCMAKPL